MLKLLAVRRIRSVYSYLGMINQKPNECRDQHGAGHSRVFPPHVLF